MSYNQGPIPMHDVPQDPEAYPQQPPPHYGGPRDGYVQLKGDPYDGVYKPKRQWQDPIFALLFVIQLLGFIAMSVLTLLKFGDAGGLGGGVGSGATGGRVTLNFHTVYLLLFVTGAALLLSTVYIILARAFTKAIMHITLVLSIVLNIGICVYYWITKYYSGAIIFTVIAIFSVLSYFYYRSRIPFSALLLQVVMDVAKHHKSVYVVAFVALIVQAALSVWYTFTVIATYVRYTPGSSTCTQDNSCSTGKVIGFIIYETFSFLWTSQVIGNVALATLAGGPFGAWYYRGSDDMPKNPTFNSFRRASTLSLGSIAFGSLVVAILELIRTLLRMLRTEAANDGNLVLVVLACCAECLIGCIESLVEYFNRYAYIEIALYGDSYIDAAKHTFNLFRVSGIDVIVNDSLVSMTFVWGAYAAGLLCSLFAYLYLRFTHPSYNADGQYTAPVLLFAFLVGLQCLLTLSSALDAGVSTIFVCIGNATNILHKRIPDLYRLMTEEDRYRHILAGGRPSG